VVRPERPRDGAPGNGLHHRRLHLDEAARIEERAQRLHHPRAQEEDLAHLRVDDEIDVALPVARLHVLEPVPLLRQRAQRLREHGERLHRHRELARARAEHLARDPDEVAEIEAREQRVVVAELVRARVELDAARAVHQMRERRLAVIALGHQATRQRHGARRRQLLVGGLVEPLRELLRPVRDGIARPEGLDAARVEGVELFPPLADEVVVVVPLAHVRAPRAHSR
jgi:hypothetical protein